VFGFVCNAEWCLLFFGIGVRHDGTDCVVVSCRLSTSVGEALSAGALVTWDDRQEVAERLELTLASVSRRQPIMEGMGFGELNW